MKGGGGVEWKLGARTELLPFDPITQAVLLYLFVCLFGYMFYYNRFFFYQTACLFVFGHANNFWTSTIVNSKCASEVVTKYTAYTHFAFTRSESVQCSSVLTVDTYSVQYSPVHINIQYSPYVSLYVLSIASW